MCESYFDLRKVFYHDYTLYIEGGEIWKSHSYFVTKDAGLFHMLELLICLNLKKGIHTTS